MELWIDLHDCVPIAISTYDYDYVIFIFWLASGFFSLNFFISLFVVAMQLSIFIFVSWELVFLKCI